jgi:hypothetical protein
VIFVRESFEWQPGPDLPAPLYHHCLVQINATHTFLAGGSSGQGAVRYAYIYSWLAAKWQPVRGMPTARTNLACGLHTDSVTGRSYIVAAGESVGFLMTN